MPDHMSSQGSDFDLFSDFPEPVFVMSRKGTILAFNRLFASRFSHSQSSILGRNAFELLAETNATPEIIANRKRQTNEVLRRCTHVTFEDQIDENYWRTSIYPVFSSERIISKLIVIVQDITSQRLAEIEQEEFRARMDYALESSHVSVWSFDIDKNILLRTLEHDRIFGYETLVPDWRLDRFFNHIYPDDLPKVKHLYDNFLENHSDFNVEFRIRRTDGEIRWVNLVGTFRFCRPGTSRSIVGIILDITEKKVAALELEQLQAQLQQSQKMELIGQLAGGIAHDFNNSLTAIIGNIELALGKIDLSLPVARNLRNAHDSALRSANLTRQLLGFARKQIIQPKAIQLNQALEKLIPMLRSLISSPIRFIWQPDTTDSVILIDPSQLDQVLSNLCINARDAIEHRGVITISTSRTHLTNADCTKGHPCQNPGDYVVLSVSDTGSGIDSKTLPHIFEPFFTTKPPGKGTGLGLSTVYGIVRQNYGNIECLSTPGKGTTFSVFFPVHIGETIDTEKNSSPGQPSGYVKETVLLVEDEPSILKILKDALEESGFEVFAALAAESAIVIADKYRERIGLLITDLILPGMTGTELSRQLQQLIPGIKTIYMSGFTFDENSRQAETLKQEQFISKPFAIHDFMNMVYQALM